MTTKAIVSASDTSPRTAHEGTDIKVVAKLAAPPVLAVVGFFWAASLRILLHDDQYAWYWAIVLLLHYGAIVVAGWAATRKRILTCVVTTAALGCWAAWSYHAVATPRFTPADVLMYAIGLMTVWPASAILVLLHRDDPRGGETTMDKIRRHAGALRAMNAIQVDRERGVITVDIESDLGTTIKEIKPEALGSFADVPEGGARIIAKPGDSVRKGVLELEPRDTNATPVPDPGPSRVGGNLNIHPGVFGPRGFILHYAASTKPPKRNLSHVLVSGMNGAGKSEFIRRVILEGLAIGGSEYEYFYFNARKTNQEPKWVLRGASKLATTKQTVIDALRWVRDEWIPERERYLGERGKREWVSGCGVPFTDIICDEYSAVGPDIERLATDLGETLRSLGARLVCGLQRTTGDRINTSFRAQFGAFVAFGCDNDDSATAALPEHVLNAGAAPQAWGNRHPGKCYVVSASIPDEEHVRPRRTYMPNEKRAAEWADHLLARREAMRQNGTARQAPAPSPEAVPEPRMEAAPMPANHASGEPPSACPGSPVDALDVDGDVALPGDEFIDLDALDEGELYEGTRAALFEAARGDEDEGPDAEAEDATPRVPSDLASEMRPAGHVAPIRELAPEDGGDMPMRLSPRMSDDEARQTARAMLLALRGEGVTEFQVTDIGADILTVTGMKGSWLSKWLGRWSEHDPVYGPPIIRRLGRGGRYAFTAHGDAA